MHKVDPQEVGFSAARLEKINPIMQRYVDEKKLAGIITLAARQGKVVHAEKFGMQEIAANKPMAFDTIFRIYSMTKPIASVALMMLHEEARFHLSDPVAKYLPEFSDMKVYGVDGELEDARREMTIRHLLTHTSGLSYGFHPTAPVDQLYHKAKPLDFGVSPREMVRILGDLPLRYHPGKVWHYSVATDVVGTLIEVLADMPFADFLQEKIFNPLGMVDTGFYVSPEQQGRFAANYGPCKENGLKVIDGVETSPYCTPNVRQSGGGGLVSTTSDYLQFSQLVLNRGELDGVRLLGRKTVELMTQNHLAPSMFPMQLGDTMPGIGFGLGFSVVMDVAQTQLPGSAGTHGWGGAANTHFWLDPVEEMLGIIMLQYMPSGTYPVIQDFKSLVYQALVD